jgi:hypothetical protein
LQQTYNKKRGGTIYVKKCINLIILSTLLAISLANGASSALASTKQTEAVSTQSIAQKQNEQNWDQANPRWWRHDAFSREDNQSSCIKDFSIENTTYQGRNEGNYGNQGDNRGYLQDNAENSGNQIIHQREISGQHKINQSFCELNGSQTNTHYAGENQGNDGNQGVNHGYIQDNTYNSGNQVIN